MATNIEKIKVCKNRIDELEKEKAAQSKNLLKLNKKLADSEGTKGAFMFERKIERNIRQAQNSLASLEQDIRRQLVLMGKLDQSIEDARQAYMKAIKEKFTLKIRPVRFNYLGIPRSGKTSFRLRLMGIIANIVSAIAMGVYKRGDYEQPSTGVAEDGGQVFIKSNVSSDLGTIQAKEQKVWSVLKDLGEEANLLNQFIYEAVQEAPPPQEPQDQPAAKPKKKWKKRFLNKLKKKLHLSGSCPQSGTPSERDLEETFSVIKDAMDAEDWETIKFLLDDLILLINTDTGGQAEFLDLQAALVQGPSFNLLFSRLVDKLDSQFKMYYTNAEGVSTAKEDSTMTLEELLFQVLASIACFSGCFSEGEDPLPEESSINKFPRLAKSKVMFVGTHRDLVSEEEFKTKDRALQDVIKNTEFYKRGIVEFALEDQLMLAADNMSGGEDEIRTIRKVLENVIEKSFEKVDIPVTWLMLSLYIRKKNVRTMSLRDCQAVAGKFGISPEELQEVLWFLHHCIGVLLYYPEVEALKDTVICQMQVVYDSTSNLIKNVFTFEKVGKMACEKFREKAQFSLADVKKAMSDHTDDLIPPQKLVKLLEHRNILTILPSTQAIGSQSKHGREPTLFMPSVLQSAQASDLSVLTTTSTSDPAPLMLRYECGYTPVGVFPAMITNLVSQHLDDWQMIEEGLRKNKVQFHVGKDCDLVTLISHPRYFEIVISRSEEFLVPTRSLCAYVRHIVMSTLDTVTQHLNYHFKMAYRFGFECPSHPGRTHLCVLSSETAEKMMCLQNPKRKQPVCLEQRHRVWFPAVEEELQSATGGDEGCGPQLDSDCGMTRPSQSLSPNPTRPSLTPTYPPPYPDRPSRSPIHLSPSPRPHRSPASRSPSRSPENCHLANEPLCFTDKPKLHQLNCLKVGSKQLKLVQRIGVDWKQLGLALEFDYDLIEIIERNSHYRIEESCYELLNRWLDGEACQPTTWARLIEALRDAEYSELAIQLKQFFTTQ